MLGAELGASVDPEAPRSGISGELGSEILLVVGDTSSIKFVAMGLTCFVNVSGSVQVAAGYRTERLAL